MQKVDVCIGLGYADVEYMQMLNICPLLSFSWKIRKVPEAEGAASW